MYVQAPQVASSRSASTAIEAHLDGSLAYPTRLRSTALGPWVRIDGLPTLVFKSILKSSRCFSFPLFFSPESIEVSCLALCLFLPGLQSSIFDRRRLSGFTVFLPSNSARKAGRIELREIPYSRALLISSLHNATSPRIDDRVDVCRSCHCSKMARASANTDGDYGYRWLLAAADPGARSTWFTSRITEEAG